MGDLVVPASLRDGLMRVRRLSGRDSAGNIIVYFDQSSHSEDHSRCRVYDSSLDDWDSRY